MSTQDVRDVAKKPGLIRVLHDTRYVFWREMLLPLRDPFSLIFSLIQPLVFLGLFGPLRRRAQAAIDRRFDRARYDASLTVQALTVRLRDDVDIDRVQTDVLGVVEQTFHPTNAAMWLRGVSR